MNNLMIFEGNKVEIFKFEGKVLFNPKDVGKCLDLSDSTVRNYLAEMNEKQAIILTNSKVLNTDIRKLANRGEKFLTESGVYKLIFKSRKEDAERFQDWVTDEVLPAIRETGGYIPASQNESDEEFLAKALLVAQKTLERKNKLLQEKEEIIELQKPKVEIYDMFMDKDGTYGFRELRKSLESGLNISIKENDLKEIMYELGWISSPRSVKKLLAKCIREGYGTTKDSIDRFGNPITVDRFTMKGREKILKYFQK